MGHPVLPNSPLSEVVFELRFAGDLRLFSSWGAMQAELRGKYSALLVPGAVVGTSPMLQAIQLATPDRQDKVLLSINSFAFATHAYQDFEAFIEAFNEAYAVFRGHSDVAEYTRLGLRYANMLPRHFGVDESQTDPGALHPCLNLRLGGWNGLPPPSLTEPSQFVYQGVRPPIELRMSLLQSEKQGSVIQLDLDAFEVGTLPVSRVESFLQNAHDFVEEAFFGVVSDEYCRYLKGI